MSRMDNAGASSLPELPLLQHNIEVVDNLCDIPLGKLVAIDCQQLQIVGDAALTEGKSYKLDIHLPSSGSDACSIHLGAECRWRRPVNIDNGGFLTGFLTGFDIADISPQAREQIEDLIGRIDKAGA